MLILKFLAKIIKILRSGATPNQIAGGLVLGMIAGLTPLFSLHNLIVLLLLIILNVNISMSLVGLGIFSAIAWFFDPLFHAFGYFMLVEVDQLQGLWTWLYGKPVIALSRFNNTVVLGSLLTALLLIVPLFFLFKKLVVLYREKLENRVQKLKIVQLLKGSKIYELYSKLKLWEEA